MTSPVTPPRIIKPSEAPGAPARNQKPTQPLTGSYNSNRILFTEPDESTTEAAEAAAAAATINRLAQKILKD